MIISQARKQDIDAILLLQKQIYRTEEKHPEAAGYLENQLKDDSCDVLVARENGNVVATVTIYYIEVAVRACPYALLEGLVVDKNARGKGVGGTLINKCIELARQKNCYKMIFTSGTDRQDAQSIYEKLGFKKWGLEFRKDL